jgi:DNA-binding transcriptional LysR family regulator
MVTSKASAVPFDAKFLRLFEELYRTHSLTRAAEHLGQEQPTVSIWLGKLRRYYGDPLFVRTAAGMQPTPRADALIGPVREALEMLRKVAGQEPAFDPAASSRNFRVCMTDASHLTLLPKLLAHVRMAAPRIRIDVVNITTATAHALESGEADLALGFLPGLEAGFYQQTLFLQDFVCLAGAAHPRIGSILTLRRFREEAHIALALAGTGHAVVDGAIEKLRIPRRILLGLPGFLALGAIVSTTDLIATVPRGIGEILARKGELRLLECPVKVPSYSVKQHWHARYHHDLGNRWLRGACASLFSQSRPGVSRTRVPPPRAK